MATAVLIPWRPGCPHREAAVAWVMSRYWSMGLHVVLAETDGPWCKAAAIAAGLEETTADRLLIADADVWCDPSDALSALDSHAWAVPHRWVHRLTLDATSAVLGGYRGTFRPEVDLECRPYRGVTGGGVVAIRRDTYRQVPLDPRFVGWGGEDHAWGIALHHLAGKPWNGTADLIHLWHPPQPDTAPVRGPRAKVKVPIDTNRNLYDRYRHAKPSRARMDALVGEAREALWPTSA